MGSVEAYETAKGRRYRALYRRPDQKQTQKRGFTTKKAAEPFLATTEVVITQGRYFDPAFLVGLLRAQIAGRDSDAPVFYGIRTGTWLRKPCLPRRLARPCRNRNRPGWAHSP